MTFPEQNVQGAGGGGAGIGSDVSSVVSADNVSMTTTMTYTDTASVMTFGDVIGGTPKAAMAGTGRDAAEPPPPSCRTGYCRNMKFFVVCLAAVFLVRGALLQYTEDILTHVGRRYPITAHELYFVIGCERIGFVGTLLFVAFFGNRMHKPYAISIGVVVCALGAILMAVPFFVSGPRLFDTKISQFAIAGLCKQSSRNVSFQTQCDLIPYKEDDGTFTFTIISMAKLLIGVGGALFASLGLVYIEEGSKVHRLPLYFGTVLCMHGFGRFIGNLLAAWFTSLPEALNIEGSQRLMQEYAVYDQERVGRWWLGYPVLASLLVCLSLMTLWFPRYITIPDWVLRRRAKRAKIQAELDRRQRLKVLASKKRHASDANGHKKSKARHRGRRSKGGDRTSRTSDGEGEGQAHSLGVVNEVDVLADEARVEGRQGKSSRNGVSNGDGVVVMGEDVTVEIPEEEIDLENLRSDLEGGQKPADTSSLDVNMDDLQDEERDKDFTDEEKAKKKRRKSPPSDSNKVEPLDDQQGSITNRRSREDPELAKSKRSSRAGQSETSRKYKKKTSNAAAVVHHKPRRIRFRKEKLGDLPQTVVKLLHNMRMVIIIIGAVLGGFYFNGYLATLPEYMYVQFQRSWGTSLILAGVTGPLAWGIGTLVGGVVTYRFRAVSLVRVTMVMVGCILTCCALTLLNMAFHCEHDTSPNATSIAVCARRCECDSYKVQYEPLCGTDGKTYPSPCHAGCTAIEKTETPGLFKFTGCACVQGGSALQGACQPGCSSLTGFAIVTFVAVFIVSTSIVPVFVLLFRSVRSRSKSFAIGFAIWSVYTISSTLGPVAFRYPRDGRCRQWGEDCLEEKVCWGYDLQPYRLIVNGIAAAFLFATAISFILVFLYLRRSKAKKLRQESLKLDNVENGDVNTQNGDVNTQNGDVSTQNGDVAAQGDEASTQNCHATAQANVDSSQHGDVNTQTNDVTAQGDDVNTQNGDIDVQTAYVHSNSVEEGQSSAVTGSLERPHQTNL